MSEQDNQQAPEDTSAASADETAADSQSENQTDSQDQAGADESKKADESGKGKSDSDTAESGDNKDQSKKQDSQDAQPKSRRSAGFRIQQLNDKNKALEAENARLKAGKTDDQAGAEDGGDQSNDTSKDSDVDKRLKRVEQGTNLVLKQAMDTEDNAEIGELFSGDLASERKAYEPKIRAMWDKPQYKDLPAADLYKIASYEDSQRKAVEAAKKADKEAKESSTGGNNSSANRNGSGTVALPPDEELLKRNELVKAGKT